MAKETVKNLHGGVLVPMPKIDDSVPEYINLDITDTPTLLTLKIDPREIHGRAGAGTGLPRVASTRGFKTLPSGLTLSVHVSRKDEAAQAQAGPKLPKPKVE